MTQLCEIIPRMTIINREHLRDQVYTRLRDMIDHRLPPGTRINVEKLSKDLMVSRTPVWEAIHRLIQEGLLTNIPNRGVFISELTPESAIELYVVREALEALAVRLAIENINFQYTEKICRILEKQFQAIKDSDIEGYSRLDFAFHTTVYTMSGNSFLYTILESIKRRCDLYPCNKATIVMSLYKDHIEIVEAIRAGDPDRAVAAFNSHNRKVITQIRNSRAGAGERR